MRLECLGDCVPVSAWLERFVQAALHWPSHEVAGRLNLSSHARPFIAVTPETCYTAPQRPGSFIHPQCAQCAVTLHTVTLLTRTFRHVDAQGRRPPTAFGMRALSTHRSAASASSKPKIFPGLEGRIGKPNCTLHYERRRPHGRRYVSVRCARISSYDLSGRPSEAPKARCSASEGGFLMVGVGRAQTASWLDDEPVKCGRSFLVTS
ncbi:hypothetical protein K466DRAFT_3559 [Polyporus arcularius HHB13444]|uniref:Uncharacterized protein n=1 Tax=Polyporus arcularius HHB13444 TaxID=1314778 RepID=A0A5C3PZG5_9APHY|nr:hypothetical protein K466DRAFT_3559 [Polyporus arcularius HHB13444]